MRQRLTDEPEFSRKLGMVERGEGPYKKRKPLYQVEYHKILLDRPVSLCPKTRALLWRGQPVNKRIRTALWRGFKQEVEATGRRAEREVWLDAMYVVASDKAARQTVAVGP